MVTRDGKGHYDVLHAAVFAEARNDNVEMVQHLLQKNVPIQANADGRWPLHIAFRVGSLGLIKLLRKEMKKRGLPELAQITTDIPSPLLLGIRMGKMSTTELATAAAHTPLSLHTFINYEPRCIPRFLEVLQRQSDIKPWHLAMHIKGADLARVIRVSPSAAVALIEAVTDTPEVQQQGWHPLPRRVSFARHDMGITLRDLVNPRKAVRVHYHEDFDWKYDVETFKAPDWHEDFPQPSHGEPVHDVSVRVCLVPNLLVAEFFAGLSDADTGGELQVFQNGVVSGSIDFVWWNGAWRVDVLHAILGLWSLGLLILESWIVGGDVKPGSQGEFRSLTAMHLQTGEGLHEALADFMPSTPLVGEIAVSAAFIGAKGVIDVVHELAQFGGCVSIHRPMDYLRDVSNLWDLFRGLVLMALFFDTRNSVIRVLVIFICWMRLLEMFTSAENVALALLPLKRLAGSLVPAGVMMLVSFLTFTHVFHYVWGHDHDWRTTFFQSFATLLTTQLPTDPWERNGLELLVTYSAVLFFSIFMLNICIGVIGTAYAEEQARVPRTFLHHRACCCLNFLLRVRVLPTQLCGRRCANIAIILALGLCVFTQVHGLLVHHGALRTRTIFFFSQLVMLLASYQTPDLQWCPTQDRKHYLWITSSVEGRLGEAFCPCGAALPDTASFCPACGTRRPSDSDACEAHGYRVARSRTRSFTRDDWERKSEAEESS